MTVTMDDDIRLWTIGINAVRTKDESVCNCNCLDPCRARTCICSQLSPRATEYALITVNHVTFPSAEPIVTNPVSATNPR